MNKYTITLAPTLSGHWYEVYDNVKRRSLGYFPSSTTILNAYPQSQHLAKWIADNGWNESQKIKSEAGERGTRVHEAVEALINGATLTRTAYNLQEWWCISTFINWWNDHRPQVLFTEVAVFSEKHGYAGRVDCVLVLGNMTIVVDWKTSGSMYPHYPLQFASYAMALEEEGVIPTVHATAGLQLGTKSKSGYKFEIHTNWKEHFDVFKNVQETWKYDWQGTRKSPKEPPVLVLPDTFQLTPTTNAQTNAIQ